MPRVLVVDDEAVVRRFVQGALEEFGYSVAVAAGATEALQRFDAEGAFDLLVTDFMMPQMRGDELAGEMRKRQPWLKVLYLTGFSGALYVAHPEFSRYESALEKPMTLSQLHDAVSLLIYGHRGGPPKP
jgi:two-component system, cell cycle sensor histidine kinase and response regulator CckA